MAILKAYFNDIQEVIIVNLKNSKKNIKVAVAWFTNPELFKIILEKRKEG